MPRGGADDGPHPMNLERLETSMNTPIVTMKGFPLTNTKLMRFVFRAWFLANVAVVATAMKDKATGITFAPKSNGLEIFGVGVRKKGPIKVYSVGMYASPALKEKLQEIRLSANEKAALHTLQTGAKEIGTTFVLEMSFKVGADKMAKAIADSVGGRYKGQEVADLKDLIAKGVARKGAATKGTKIQFDCSSEGVEVSIDGEVQGKVGSQELASAMCDVYLDDKCVSPALRRNILETSCM